MREPNVYHTILSSNGGADWRFEDVLVFQPLTSTFACRGSCRNLRFHRITSDAGTSAPNFELAGTGHRITNALITNGVNTVPGDTTLANNYQWNLDGRRVGVTKDPQYRNPEQGDYTPRAPVTGAGSTVTSVAQLVQVVVAPGARAGDARPSGLCAQGGNKRKNQRHDRATTAMTTKAASSCGRRHTKEETP